MSGFYVDRQGNRDHFRRAIKAAESALDQSAHRPGSVFTVWQVVPGGKDRLIGRFENGKRVLWNP